MTPVNEFEWATPHHPGPKQKRTIEMRCGENDATALAPAFACQQIFEKKMTSCGVFVPPEKIPARNFMDRIKKFATHNSGVTEEV